MPESAAEFFYLEWARRTPGAARSVERAGLLVAGLGIAAHGIPVLTVVGSKGKGTAATYASAYLVAAGRRVVTVTSPGLRRDNERIRVDGAAIPERVLAGLGRRLRRAARTLPARRDDGYLSPSGLYIVAGVLHARDVGAEVVVLEAGMGGASDEVSLFPPDVVAITAVFGEHVGILGDTPAEIAADKAGVVTATTSAVASLPQTPAVWNAVSTTVAGHGVTAEAIMPGASGVPAPLLPAGFGRMNAELGCVAAQRLLGTTVPGDRLSEVLSSVRLPGRLSWHPVPGTATTVLIDSAIDRAGAAAALTHAHRRWSRVDHVVVCLPDHKDVPGVIAELAGLAVTYVRLPGPRFTHPLPPGWAVVDAEELSRDRLASLGRRIVILGTVYFTGRMLDLMDARTERLFEASLLDAQDD